MRIIKSFFKLNNSEKIIIIKAFSLLWIIRILLCLFSFSSIEKITNRLVVIYRNNETTEFSIEKLIWAVNVMSIYTIGATCLTRAIAAQILLARYNYSSLIKIGVSKNGREFEAHAWLESDDKIILGESEKYYIPIFGMGGKTQ